MAKGGEKQPERSPERKSAAIESKGGVEGEQGGWTVYILLCRNGAYYVGVTNDFNRRWREHRTGRGGHYTRWNPPVRLVYREAFPTGDQGEGRERQFKGWTRRKKQALIAGDTAPVEIVVTFGLHLPYKRRILLFVVGRFGRL